MIRYATLLAFGMPTLLLAQSESRSLPPDRSKPVPAKSEIIAAWQKRQSAINSFRFTWTEEQVHPKGWLANPRELYFERAQKDRGRRAGDVESPDRVRGPGDVLPGGMGGAVLPMKRSYRKLMVES